MEKLHQYEGLLGIVHQLRDRLSDRCSLWKERLAGVSFRRPPQPPAAEGTDYSHIFRKKTRWELVRVSMAVMGIEFSYAAETAFVSPTLLEIGVGHAKMTMVWALSPLVGFFLTPILGSLSDRCSHPLGRRRPFILLLSAGVLVGLILVPNGKMFGERFGDTGVEHTWGVLFTVLGTVLLDFDADACQSPARTYLLDVTLPEDHARGLSTFTVMAGLGGFMGYAMGGIDWDTTWIGEALGGHVKAVFSLITVIFIFCISCTVTSFREIPLQVLNRNNTLAVPLRRPVAEQLQEEIPLQEDKGSYGTLEAASRTIETTLSRATLGDPGEVLGPRAGETVDAEPEEEASPTLREYLMSVVYMPSSLQILCLTNLFSWMAHVCYSLYFTDYVGEAVFGGDPKAEEGSEARELYKAGVRFGCYGMSLYSLSCSCYSVFIERLITRYKARKVYMGGLLFFGLGMLLMAASRSKVGVICFSWTAGIMYSTLFTMPYLLVAHYHATDMFDVSRGGSGRRRGLGTDVALVSSMVFLAQFCLSLCMGSLVSLSGTTTVVVLASGLLSICGSLAASKVLYLDL